jgi:3-carboxy-cis,cis-muconate cycloisomerase
MPTSAIDSLIFRDIFGSPAMREIWSDPFRTQKYLDWGARPRRGPGRADPAGSSR